jgi:hypothetical protein
MTTASTNSLTTASITRAAAPSSWTPLGHPAPTWASTWRLPSPTRTDTSKRSRAWTAPRSSPTTWRSTRPGPPHPFASPPTPGSLLSPNPPPPSSPHPPSRRRRRGLPDRRGRQRHRWARPVRWHRRAGPAGRRDRPHRARLRTTGLRRHPPTRLTNHWGSLAVSSPEALAMRLLEPASTASLLGKGSREPSGPEAATCAASTAPIPERSPADSQEAGSPTRDRLNAFPQ